MIFLGKKKTKSLLAKTGVLNLRLNLCDSSVVVCKYFRAYRP